MNLSEQLLAVLRSLEDPAGLRRLLRLMQLPASDRQYLKGLLGDLVDRGEAVKVGARYWVPEGASQALTIKREKRRRQYQRQGLLHVTSRGFGFVTLENGRSYLIPAAGMGNACHGDRVRVEETQRPARGRPVARVVGVEQEGPQYVVGVFRQDRGGLEVVLLGGFRLPAERLVKWPAQAQHQQVGLWKRTRNGCFAFDRFLGNFDDPQVDERIVLAEQGFPLDVSEGMESEIRSMTTTLEPAVEKRRDFTNELVFTVDGADARDFDDALHLKACEGGYEVGIHIADVSAWVGEGMLVDQHARLMGNSVYFPHRAVPMLPTELSADLCSLNPGQTRLVVSVVCTLDSRGRLLSSQICRGLIQSQIRLTYSQVAAACVVRDPDVREELRDVVDALDLGIELSRQLRQRRSSALKLETGEPVMTLDESLNLRNVGFMNPHAGHQMIEAFMVLANEVVAAFMIEQGISIPFRHHDEPDMDQLEALGKLVSTRGLKLPANWPSDPVKGLNAVFSQLERMKDPAPQAVWQTKCLQALKLAVYHPRRSDHFGLGSDHYCHFTSPIRRYADLMVHRRLLAVLDQPDLKPESMDDDDLAGMCQHLSGRERAADRAERTFFKMKVFRHLQSLVGSEFSGVIQDVRPHGLVVQLKTWFVDGLVPLQCLTDDIYDFVPDRLMMVGAVKGHSYGPGDAVRVRLMKVDLFLRELDLSLLEMEKAPFQIKVRQTGKRGRARDRRELATKRPQKKKRRR